MAKKILGSVIVLIVILGSILAIYSRNDPAQARREEARARDVAQPNAIEATETRLWYPALGATADLYVSPTGNPGASGTYDDPLDLQTALASSGPVQPGCLVILKEGVYSGRFVSSVAGAAQSPVIFAAEPGKRVTLDGIAGTGDEVLLINGNWVQFRDLEITNSSMDRDQVAEADGVTFFAPNSKLINCIIHDTAQGVGFWRTAIDSDMYGNVIYNNGYRGETRGHGHAIYTQNRTGTKRIANNIMFFGYGYGIHAYETGDTSGTQVTSIQRFEFENNVWFRTGASNAGGSLAGNSDGFLLGGHQPVDRSRVFGNHSWGPVANARNAQIGWSSTIGEGGTLPLWNEYIELRDNYLIGNTRAGGYWDVDKLLIEGNTFYGQDIHPDATIFTNNLFAYNQLPTGKKVVLQPNEYDPNRIDIIIYNWDESNHVSVSLGDLLETGTSYRIYSVFDLWEAPVVEGTYQGGAIDVPMGTVTPPQPNGYPDAGDITGADDPGKTFGVFILRSM